MNDYLKNCSSAILAGGENRRMPVSKAFIEVDGQKIIERNLGLMKRLFKKIFIVTNQPGAYSYLDVPMLGDIFRLNASLRTAPPASVLHVVPLCRTPGNRWWT